LLSKNQPKQNKNNKPALANLQKAHQTLPVHLTQTYPLLTAAQSKEAPKPQRTIIPHEEHSSTLNPLYFPFTTSDYAFVLSVASNPESNLTSDVWVRP